MARSRNLKPAFFLNEDLAACSPLARLMFAGLWCVADREGRLEDRPKRLKAEILPYDACDPDALLDELAKRAFILRYCVGGRRLIAVTAFVRHQNPHVKEAASTIPAPDLHGASMVPQQEVHDTSPADSLNPLTDSLVSDSPTQAPARAQERRAVYVEGRFEGHADTNAAPPNPVAPFAIALNKVGFRCTTMNPDLIAFVEEGGQVEHLLDCASQPDCKGKPAGYVIAFARRERAEHARPVRTGSLVEAKPRSAVDRVLANIQRAQDEEQRLGVIDGEGRRILALEVANG